MANSSFAFFELSGTFYVEYFPSKDGWVLGCRTHGYRQAPVLFCSSKTPASGYHWGLAARMEEKKLRGLLESGAGGGHEVKWGGCCRWGGKERSVWLLSRASPFAPYLYLFWGHSRCPCPVRWDKGGAWQRQLEITEARGLGGCSGSACVQGADVSWPSALHLPAVYFILTKFECPT